MYTTTLECFLAVMWPQSLCQVNMLGYYWFVVVQGPVNTKHVHKKVKESVLYWGNTRPVKVYAKFPKIKRIYFGHGFLRWLINQINYFLLTVC